MRPFCFLHAADLHLDRPLTGLAEAPNELRSLMADAACQAAERLFELAANQRVAFVVLAGDVLHASEGGARPWSLLLDQFERLGSQGIAVYWAAGRSDCADHWPAVALPPLIRRFACEHVEEALHEQDGQPLARVLARGFSGRKPWPSDLRTADPAVPFTLAVCYGPFDAGQASQGVDYWALGGQHGRKSLASSPVVHYPGTPQARRPSETGAHGCTLVEVDESGQVRTRFQPIDLVRFVDQSVTLRPGATREHVEQALLERAAELRSASPGVQLLVRWSLHGEPALAHQLRHTTLSAELLALLRSQASQSAPGLWSTAVEAEPADELPPALYEEETILGELLRTVRHFAEHAEVPLDLEPLIAERHLAGSLAPLAKLGDREQRRRVLDDVARLGVELLTGEGRRE